MAISANYDYEGDLNRLKEAQKNAAIADLENTRNQALSNLQAESQKNASTYNAQRSSANAQNRMSARNFQEYLATTGRANSGLSAQARMQGANNLQTSINTLNAGEAAANADINRRTTDAQNSYNSGLASANATIESNYIQNLMNERQKAFEREQAELNRQLQERQFEESVRQFNENLALQRQQMYSNFRSGRSSGAGGSSKKEQTNANTPAPVTKAVKSGTKASSSLTKELNKKAKTNKGWSYYDTGKSTIRGYQVDGTFYYKKGDSWVAL